MRTRIRPIDLVDVLVYLVVLGTFTQLFPQVLSETFLASVITAILLKVVLEAVVWVKTRVVNRIKKTDTVRVKVVSAVGLALLGGGSKALILWLTDLVLGDAVYLGGFWSVTLLVVILMLARAGVRATLKQ